MEIREMDQNTFADLFAPVNTDDNLNLETKPGFGMNSDNNTDIFNIQNPDPKNLDPNNPDNKEVKQELDENGNPKEVTTEQDDDKSNKSGDADILGSDTEKPGTPGRKPKYDFSDAAGYFEDRIKSGKFVAIDEEDDQGNTRPFIPKTPEEFDEVINLQVDYKVNEFKKKIEESWYESKSPAWKATMKYAEMTDDPSEVLPFIQGIKNIDSVQGIDESTPEGAEMIVRARMEQMGETKDVIDEQIDALKSTDRLISTASKHKPIILEQEKKQLTQMVAHRRAKEAEYQQLVSSIRENAIEAIEAPIYGNQKLKMDEKAAVYELIAEPSEETKGYAIYTAIDNLFEKGDFGTLTKIALLLAKEKSFLHYISTNAKHETAEGLQRKLRVAGDGRTSSSNIEGTEDKRPVIKRNQYTGTPRFGR